MNEAIYCQFCHLDPFEYVRVDDKRVAVAISCCEPAITKYYQGLTKMSPVTGSDLLKLDGLDC
jgi:hypothetical protein